MPIVVDFPHPLGPNRPIIEPLLILKLIFFTAKVFLNFLAKLLNIVIYMQKMANVAQLVRAQACGA